VQFPIPPSLGVRFEVEAVYDLLGTHGSTPAAPAGQEGRIMRDAWERKGAVAE
jgi:hypothetical protein